MIAHIMGIRAAVVASCLSVTLLAQGGALTDAEVEAAIAAAKQPKFQSSFVEAKGRFMADYSVLLQGPVGRTMDLAREAFDSYKPFKASDVPIEVKAHEISVGIIKHYTGSPVIKNVVFLPLGATSREAAIQKLEHPARPDPLSRRGIPWRDRRPRTWKPRLGAEASPFVLFDRFAESELPPGDLQILVVTDAGEQRYTVKAEDRKLIR